MLPVTCVCVCVCVRTKTSLCNWENIKLIQPKYILIKISKEIRPGFTDMV